jgi:hypothetical protein
VRTVLNFILSVMLCPLGVLQANEHPAIINPYPRQVLRTESLQRCVFHDGTGGWTPLHDCTLSAAEGALRIQSTGTDPYLVSPPLHCEGPCIVRLRVKCASAGDGQVFWTTTQSPNTDEARSQHFKLIHDNQWHNYSVPLSAAGTIAGLRLDPGEAPGLIEVAQMEVVREILHPLEIGCVHAEGHRIDLSIRNHSAETVAFVAAGQKHAIARNTMQQISFKAPGTAPFAAIRVVVKPEGLPSIDRMVFIADLRAEADWVTRRSELLTLRVARDGSGARIEKGDRLLGLVAPLVWRNGVIPRLKLTEEGQALRFSGEGVIAEVVCKGEEISVRIQSDTPCEGPVVRAPGTLEQGVLAGVEYLGKGESSSSTLDIESEEHIRFAPDPLKVTMPLMALVTDRASVMMTWRDMSLQPVFAAPNFLDGAEGHRASLCGSRIDATIRVTRPAQVEDAVLWAVNKRGLPPLPHPPRDWQAQMALCLRTLSGPPLKSGAGWGHCADPGYPRHYYADFASTVWRLSAQTPILPAVLPSGGSHIPNETIYFVSGRARQWLDMKAAHVRAVFAAQRPDGSFRYDGKYRRGHFEDTSSGYCAGFTVVLLEHARATGDKTALAAGLKALEFMKRFHTPRGAQTWECPLHTPDILASARLVQAYVRGFELTGNREYLDRAQAWAVTGLPFVYQWNCKPVMAYATTPVLGATNWRAPNWIGLPVQWCGYDYAYSLTMLMAHDKSFPWRQLAEGILIAAEQMQYPEGPNAGCVPDSFDLATQTRRPPNINPCAVVSLRLALAGRLDSLALAVGEGHRIVSPFPVTIRAGSAHIRGRKDVAFQILVDGERVVDVVSRGDDVVPLCR